MGMTRQAKEEAVAVLSEKLSRAKAGLVTDFQGLDVASVMAIRVKFKEANVEYKVVKNTLMKRALAGTPIEGLAGLFQGPKAVAFKYDEEYGALGKIAKDLVKAHEHFNVHAGFIEEDILEGQPGLDTMASLPTMDEARAQLLGVINTPAAKLLAQINAPASKVLSVIEAKIKKDEAAA